MPNIEPSVNPSDFMHARPPPVCSRIDINIVLTEARMIAMSTPPVPIQPTKSGRLPTID